EDFVVGRARPHAKLLAPRARSPRRPRGATRALPPALPLLSLAEGLLRAALGRDGAGSAIRRTGRGGSDRGLGGHLLRDLRFDELALEDAERGARHDVEHEPGREAVEDDPEENEHEGHHLELRLELRIRRPRLKPLVDDREDHIEDRKDIEARDEEDRPAEFDQTIRLRQIIDPQEPRVAKADRVTERVIEPDPDREL